MSEQDNPTPIDETPARTPGVKVEALTTIRNLEDGRIYYRGDVLEMFRPLPEIRALQELCLIVILDPEANPAVVIDSED